MSHRPDYAVRRRIRRLLARLGAVVVAVFAILFATAGPAAAHAVLVSSDPRDGVDLPAAPAQVSITFDEAVGLRPGYLRVIDGAGHRVDTGAAFHPSGHDDVIAVGLRPGLGRAAYVASYRIISADSHPVSGAIQFTVGGAAPTAARPIGGGTDALVSTLFDGARTMTFLGLALAGGAWLLLLARSRTGTGPLDPAGPMRSWRTVRVGTVLALVGLGAEFFLQGPYAAGETLVATTEPALLDDTVSSGFGRWHLTACVLLMALVAAAFRGHRGRSAGRGHVVLAAAAWIAVLTAVAESGHAGVRSPVWLGLPVTVAHLLAMSTWIGGLAVLALVVLPKADPPAGWISGLLPVFSRVAMVCVATLAATGTYQAWREVGSWSALFDTTYGQLVLTKIELFAVLVALGAVARSRVAAWPVEPEPAPAPGPTPSGHSPAGATHRRLITASRQLRTGVLLELGVAAAVLCVSAVLVAEPPGRDAALAAQASASATVTAPLSATRTVTVQVTPARHGTVIIDVTVSPGVPIQRLTLAAAQNAAGVGPLPITVRPTATGVYRSAPVDLPVAGDWQFSVAVQTSAFDVATATPTLHLA